MSQVEVKSVQDVYYNVALPKLAYDRNASHTRKQMHEYASWLHNGMWFSGWIYLQGDEVDKLVDEIWSGMELPSKKSPYYATYARDAIRGVLANLYMAYVNEKPVKITNKVKHFASMSRKYGMPYTPKRFKSIVDYLVRAGYIKYIKGAVNYKKTPGRRTNGPKMWLTPLGYERIFACKAEVVFEEKRVRVPLARLINDKGELVDIYDKGVEKNIRDVLVKDERFLKALNHFLARRKIVMEVEPHLYATYKKRLEELERQHYIRRLFDEIEEEVRVKRYEVINRPITRVYARGNITLGGRFYNGSHLALPSCIRSSHLYIDGSKCIELDFSSLHISMLYHLKGLDVISNPYKYYQGDYRRTLLKHVGLIAINAVSRRSTLNAIRSWLRAEGLDGFDAVALLDEFIEHNKAISEYICSDIGVRLQKYDSDIMRDILDECMKRDIPALPVHDSVVVPEQHGEVVYDVMLKAYMKHMGAHIGIAKK